jgi:hypothetical protein
MSSDVCDECGCEKFPDRDCPECSVEFPPFNDRVTRLLAERADPRDAELAALRVEVARIASCVMEPIDLPPGCPPLVDRIVAQIEDLYRERTAHRSEAHREAVLEAEVARLRLPAEVVETIRNAMHRERRWTLRVREVDSCLAAFNAAYPESEAT